MEVKVGQVWRTKSYDLDDVDFEILCIGKSNAIVNMMYSDGHLECCKNIRHIQLSADLVKDSDAGLSDLEIVQKALEKTRASLSVNNGDFIVEELESCGGNTVAVIDSAIFENAESLLTWAKQMVGHE